MLTILFGLLAAGAVFTVLYLTTEIGLFWAIVLAVVGFMIVQIIVSLLLRRKINQINGELQDVMMRTRKEMERKQMFIAQRANPTMQRMQMEAMQKKGIEEALVVCEQFNALCKWNLMMKKQIATMQMTFQYQLHNWEEVDRLLPKCIFLDPQTISMKLVRLYKTKDESLAKFYKKRTRLLRKDSIVLPAATYSWILLKQGNKEEALKVLNEALKKTENAVLSKNRDAIINDKLKQFSNADLAEGWYALGLEEPKIQKIQQRVAYR